ncbi:MAG: lyase family protein [Thermoanaerobaculaceae bacterium]
MASVLLAVSQDLGWRASGPYGGLGELLLPAVQPGSSLMPGKVNPVIPEAVAQVCLSRWRVWLMPVPSALPWPSLTGSMGGLWWFGTCTP